MKKRMTTIKAQLFKRLLVLLFLIVLIAISGIVVTMVLKKSSNRIVFEYIELNAVQELRLSFNKTFIPAYNYLHYHDEQHLEQFKSKIDSTHWHLENCKQILSNRHSKELLTDFEEFLSYFEHVVIESANSDIDLSQNRELIPMLENVIEGATGMVENILFETKHEIDEFIKMNATAVSHSTATILILSIVVIVLGFFIGSLFVSQMVRQINLLSLYTKEIESGNWEVVAPSNSNKELDDLSKAFNSMVNNLRFTTVSRDLFNNILSSMQELIIVADVNHKVIMCNNATYNCLGYKQGDIQGESISKVISGFDNIIRNCAVNCNCTGIDDTFYIHKSGNLIPVMMSCSVLYDKNKAISGFVFAAFDITEKIETQKRLEAARRKTMININESQEKERLRIAKDLHDGLGQMLTGISYYIENYFIEKFGKEKEFLVHLNNIQNQLDAAIKESKNIAYNLIPMQLKDFGLSAAINNLVDRLNVQQKTKFEFSYFNFESRINEKLEKVLFRIVQEISNNIIKHAKAETANIQLIKHEKTISLIIFDDGIGFDYVGTIQNPTKKGIGLSSIQERVISFNGFLNVSSGAGQGTEFLIEIPID